MSYEQDLGKFIAALRKQNVAVCRKCGDFVHSKHRHDFAQCSCGSIAVDGGQDYRRQIGNPEDFIFP